MPSKNELARSCKIVQESCMQDLLGTCTQYVPFLARFLHNLAHILQEMVQDFARDAARIITCKFAQFFCKILEELVQDCARIVQEKGHIACTCQASLACKILAQSCMILQVHFCWGGTQVTPRTQPAGIEPVVSDFSRHSQLIPILTEPPDTQEPTLSNPHILHQWY